MSKIAVILAVACLGLTAGTASAQRDSTSQATMIPSPFFCAGHEMSAMNARVVARYSVLVTLQRYVNGKLQYDEALTVRKWRGNFNRDVGYAHPGCWTAIPKPGKNVRLCITVRNGNRAFSTTGDPMPACPKPKVLHSGGLAWTTITFRVTSPG